MSKNYNIDDKISYICKNEYSHFLNVHNVVGIGLGFKIKKGFYTNKKCIKVFVQKKEVLNKLSKNNIIPKMYKGIETDVIECGSIQGYSLTQRVRPTICGYSIGPWNIVDATTLGGIVIRDGEKFILSCNHGIVYGMLPIGTEVLQPGVIDGGKHPNDKIGCLNQYVPLKPITMFESPINTIDACIINLVDQSIVNTEVYGIGKFKGIQSPRLNQPVVKVGCSSEITTGKITTINATIKIKIGNKKYLFIDQIETTSMGIRGDSASILVGNGNRAMGILCGGGDSDTFYGKIDTALKTLNVKIAID